MSWYFSSHAYARGKDWGSYFLDPRISLSIIHPSWNSYFKILRRYWLRNQFYIVCHQIITLGDHSTEYLYLLPTTFLLSMGELEGYEDHSVFPDETFTSGECLIIQDVLFYRGL